MENRVDEMFPPLTRELGADCVVTGGKNQNCLQIDRLNGGFSSPILVKFIVFLLVLQTDSPT
ncbi:MAG: hypothetical protein OI74_10050 [Gammaproteobacteria bacterium (ex Lamellibrachia satsuma)]|nr:MAG: hypothetical protein OI74_10050 [Gammaproteobacteria bacterium (ex Lamellibrachia satsuma)]RRS35706.1 MAG: hypothetical protein NV67_10105 [Gammaproteobacteria bacterium (ex Lamellibrachia satsuma)]